MAAAVTPGWYWYDYTAAEAPDVIAFCSRNAPTLRVRKTFRAESAGTEIMVFEVVGGPLVWSLPRWPTQAPKGLDTDLAQIAKEAQNPSPTLRATLEELAGKPFEALRKTAENVNTAVNLIIFGGAAILLYNLFQRTRAPEGDE